MCLRLYLIEIKMSHEVSLTLIYYNDELQEAESRQLTEITTHTDKAITEMQLYPAIKHRQ